MIKIRAEINEMEKTQTTEKTNLEKKFNQHHGESQQIFKKDRKSIIQTLSENRGENTFILTEQSQ